MEKKASDSWPKYMVMENLTAEDDKNIRPEKRHFQSECDSETSLPKIIATPRRTGGRAPVTNCSARTSANKTSSCTSRSLRRTPVVRSTKISSSSRIPVGKVSSTKRRSNSSPLVKSDSKIKTSKRNPVEEKSARETSVSYRTPMLEKKAVKMRLFLETPVKENCNMNRSSESPVQKQSNIREFKSSDKTSDSNTSEAVIPNICQVPKMCVSKSLTPKSHKVIEEIQSLKKKSLEKLLMENKCHETEISDLLQNKKCLTEKEKCSSLVAMEESNFTDKGKESCEIEKDLKLKQKEEFMKGGACDRKIKISQEVDLEKPQLEGLNKDVEKDVHTLGKASTSLTKECTTATPDETESGSAEASDALIISKDIQAEVEKVKQRRSTIGRGRKSGQSMGGRQSLCAAFPVMSLRDQIRRIDKDLPWASKVSCLIDISIREALRRLEDRLPENECVSDLKMDLLRKSESIAKELSYKIAGYPLVAEASLLKSSYEGDVKGSVSKIDAYKNRTKELEQEYKTWKSLMKERKIACQTAEREFREAQSGETKIDDEQISQLSIAQRCILASRPNYQEYLQEVQMVRESATLMLQEVKRATNITSGMITACRLSATSCCAAIEKLSFGHLQNQPTKYILASMIEMNRARDSTNNEI